MAILEPLVKDCIPLEKIYKHTGTRRLRTRRTVLPPPYGTGDSKTCAQDKGTSSAINIFINSWIKAIGFCESFLRVLLGTKKLLQNKQTLSTRCLVAMYERCANSSRTKQRRQYWFSNALGSITDEIIKDRRLLLCAYLKHNFYTPFL